MTTRIERLKAREFLKDRAKRAPRETRKQREAPPPSRWARSPGGTPFKLVKTSQINEADEWLYRCDFGNIKGNGLFSITDLEKSGAVFLDEQPADWQLAEWRRRPADDDADEPVDANDGAVPV